MTHYRFAKFHFDTTTYTLTQGCEALDLRPKTAVLLSVLLENHQQILSKSELFEQVWQSSYVQDQSLFQAISEIRKLLAPLQPIQTHPNIGYQWTLPLLQPKANLVNFSKNRRWVAAATAALLIVLAVGQNPLANDQRSMVITPSIASTPAMQAYNQGLRHLQSQDFNQAGYFFDLAQQENPRFLEAGLLKAEVLLSQQQYPIARHQAQQVLNMAKHNNEQYMQVAARALLSQISEQDGQLQSALEWALEANSLAHDQLDEFADHSMIGQEFACVAQDTGQRITDLLLQTPDKPLMDSLPEDTKQPSPLLDRFANQPDTSTQSPHCDQMRQPELGETDLDLSQCINDEQLYNSLALLTHSIRFKTDFYNKPV